MNKKQSFDPINDPKGKYVRKPSEDKVIIFDLENGFNFIVKVVKM
jgi:hypothetical protein